MFTFGWNSLGSSGNGVAPFTLKHISVKHLPTCPVLSEVRMAPGSAMGRRKNGKQLRVLKMCSWEQLEGKRFPTKVIHCLSWNRSRELKFSYRRLTRREKAQRGILADCFNFSTRFLLDAAGACFGNVLFIWSYVLFCLETVLCSIQYSQSGLRLTATMGLPRLVSARCL